MTQETTQTQLTARSSGASSEAVTRAPAGGAGAVGGTTQIADSVVARIAALAAREVPGIHDMAAGGAGGAFANLTGRDQPDKGVTVEVGQTECIVDLSIVVDAGASIPHVADALRRAVSSRLTAMTGLTVKEVNINVTDIYVAAQPKG